MKKLVLFVSLLALTLSCIGNDINSLVDDISRNCGELKELSFPRPEGIVDRELQDFQDHVRWIQRDLAELRRLSPAAENSNGIVRGRPFNETLRAAGRLIKLNTDNLAKVNFQKPDPKALAEIDKAIWQGSIGAKWLDDPQKYNATPSAIASAYDDYQRAKKMATDIDPRVLEYRKAELKACEEGFAERYLALKQRTEQAQALKRGVADALKAAEFAKRQQESDARMKSAVPAKISDAPVPEIPAGSLAGEAKAKFEKWVSEGIKERKASTVVASVEVPRGGDESTSYVVELESPGYKIYAEDLDAVKAKLSAADRLNGKLGDMEWRGIVVIECLAYRVLSKSETRTKKTIQLWDYKRPFYEDGAWHDAQKSSRLRLPLVGQHRLQKGKDGWQIGELEGDEKRQFKDRIAPLAEGRLSQSIPPALEDQPLLSDDESRKQASEAFEAYVFKRTPASIILKEEEGAGDARNQTITEYNNPTVTIEPLKLTRTDWLNGLEGVAKIDFKSDAFRVLDHQPERKQKKKATDGSWVSAFTGQSFRATKQAGAWTVVQGGQP